MLQDLQDEIREINIQYSAEYKNIISTVQLYTYRLLPNMRGLLRQFQAWLKYDWKGFSIGPYMLPDEKERPTKAHYFAHTYII